MKRLLVHVGYHKTGSTWLQTRLFPRCDLGFAYPDDAEARRLKRELVFVHALDFRPEPARRAMLGRIEAMAAGGEVGVISWERFSGSPHSGGYDSAEIAQRLHLAFPEARVLAVIREQRDMILSSYRQYVRSGGTSTLTDYATRARNVSFPVFTLDYFNYDGLIARYQQKFGRENVLVLPYEQLVSDPHAFLARIFTFVGLPQSRDVATAQKANPGNRGFTTSVKRRLNPFLAQEAFNGYGALRIKGMWRLDQPLCSFLDRFAPGSLHRHVDALRWRELEAMTRDRYAPSNRRTQELTGLDLGRYGYEL